MRHVSLQTPLNAGEPSIGADLLSSCPTLVALMGDLGMGEARQ